MKENWISIVVLVVFVLMAFGSGNKDGESSSSSSTSSSSSSNYDADGYKKYERCVNQAKAKRGCYASSIQDPRWARQNCSRVLPLAMQDCEHLSQ